MNIIGISIYINIPFCEKKCNYCDFPSFVFREKQIDVYLRSLENELIEFKRLFSNIQARTVYIGGGTPTFLNTDQLEYLFKIIYKYIDMDNVSEFSIEVNPGSINNKKIEILKNYCINRVSIGVQSMNNRELEILGRIHNDTDVLRTIELLNNNSLENYNIDLMYGIPEQTITSWKETLNTIIDLSPKHISTYNLNIEKDTVFYNLYEKNNLLLPNEDEIISMYSLAIDELIKASYEHYEISNFCQAGYLSEHNLTYWNNYNYLGFGSSAWSFIGNIRYSNPTSLDIYTKNYMQLPETVSFAEMLTRKEQVETCKLSCQMEDFIMLGLRKNAGISVGEFKKRYLKNFDNMYSLQVGRLLALNMLQTTEVGYKLTDKGRLLSNEVIANFLT